MVAKKRSIFTAWVPVTGTASSLSTLRFVISRVGAPVFASAPVGTPILVGLSVHRDQLIGQQLETQEILKRRV